VRAQLERYRLTRLVGADAYVPAVADILQSVTSAVAGQARRELTAGGTTDSPADALWTAADRSGADGVTGPSR
jgi:hypothetical protein